MPELFTSNALLPTVNSAPGLVVPMPTLEENVAPAAVIVPVSVGDADRTTLPVPVAPVLQAMLVGLVAMQKSLVVSVPKLVVELVPIDIQDVPLQYVMI